MLHGGQLVDFARTKEVTELEYNIGPMVTALCGRSTLRVAGRTEERGPKKKKKCIMRQIIVQNTECHWYTARSPRHWEQ